MDPRLCVVCRSSKYLCGLAYCPIVVKSITKKIVVPKEMIGSSPPSIFVGRYGYPKVSVYPSAPPVVDDTSVYEDPKTWLNMDLNTFLSLRLSLVRGGESFKVTDANNPPRFLHDVQTLSISSGPSEIEMEFTKEPRKIVLDETLPPIGPSAPIRGFKLGRLSTPQKIVERVYEDKDLKSRDAVMTLYNNKVEVNIISRLLSVGVLGVKRKLVPTRWSITAVDKVVSDSLIEEIKHFETVDKIEVYVRRHMKNLFAGILIPGNWAFEWGEAWFPGSTWNQFGHGEVALELDYEGYRGRRTYPKIGGCYYASRLGIAESLRLRKRQAMVILWREIYPGFNLPVGVWFVRENIREMFKQRPEVFDTLDQALRRVKGELKVDLQEWLNISYVVKLFRSRLF
ncbi:hypothetical protein SUSAZ_05345 [Sulfolobus acidocaldarius SUSAZ]|nr:hypothetical protein SUSAZ_05345 [Sulfolobus acidocaldarius SUSAZ]